MKIIIESEKELEIITDIYESKLVYAGFQFSVENRTGKTIEFNKALIPPVHDKKECGNGYS